MIAIRFLRKCSKRETPLQNKVVYSSRVSKRKRAPTSGVTVVIACLRKMRSPLIPIRIPLVPSIGGTNSQPINLEVPYVSSPKPYNFSRSTKGGRLDFHIHATMAHTLTADLDHAKFITYRLGCLSCVFICTLHFLGSMKVRDNIFTFFLPQPKHLPHTQIIQLTFMLIWRVAW